MHTSDQLFLWAVATPFPTPDSLYWYFHNAQFRQGFEIIPGRVYQSPSFTTGLAYIDYYPDGNIRLVTQRGEKNTFPYRRLVGGHHTEKGRVMVLIKYTLSTGGINILSATTDEDFRDFINRNKRFGYLNTPETYRVEFREHGIRCTGPMELIIERTRKHFSPKDNDALKRLLEDNTNWYIDVHKKRIPLDSTPFIVRRVIKSQSAG